MRTPYEKYLCASAEFEVEQLKNSGQEFVLDKEKFNPQEWDACIYGQVFGRPSDSDAEKFKEDNCIRTGFKKGVYMFGYKWTALECLTYLLWESDKQEQVYKIVEQFATWKNVPETTVNENLFTL